MHFTSKALFNINTPFIQNCVCLIPITKATLPKQKQNVLFDQSYLERKKIYNSLITNTIIVSISLTFGLIGLCVLLDVLSMRFTRSVFSLRMYFLSSLNPMRMVDQLLMLDSLIFISLRAFKNNTLVDEPLSIRTLLIR